MITFRKYIFMPLLVAALFFASCSGLKTAFNDSEIIETGDAPVKKFKLENNMPVLIVEEPDSRVVTLDVWVNTGSQHEPKDINGVSHFLEHMLFKGTEKRGVGEIDAMIEEVGGQWNAGTSIEFTHYYLTVGTPFVETGMDALSDAIGHSSIDPVELEKERMVILEEYHRKQDNPASFLFTEAFSESYDQSPNKWPVLGEPETIKAITREKMMDYYHSRYAPENMVLIVVGGVKAEEIMPKLEEYFGAIDRPFSGNNQQKIKTVRKEKLFVEYERPIKKAYMVMTFPAPDLSSPQEVYAADILSYIMGEGRSSRLHQHIKEDKELVSGISMNYPTHRRDGLFLVFATFDYEKLHEVREAVSGELKELRNEEPSGEEMEKVKRMIMNHSAFGHETTSGRSSEIGYYFTLTGDTTFDETYLEKIQEVEPEEVQKIAQKYLDPEKANIFIVKPSEMQSAQ